ncbi:MAG: hypothetical protein K2X47_20215, partial [Bdellovibrionales bacterium]|nr:hypothetical protein [Bdellovibrionales bacterium]
MKIEIVSGNAHSNESGASLVFVATKAAAPKVDKKSTSKSTTKMTSTKDGAKFVLHGSAKELALTLDLAMEEKSFSGKMKETIFYRNVDGVTQTLVVGLGSVGEINGEGLRMSVAAAVKQLRAQKVKSA